MRWNLKEAGDKVPNRGVRTSSGISNRTKSQYKSKSDKLGKTSADYSGYHIRTVTNCLAFHNGYGGFSQQNARGLFWVYNNTTYHNTDKADQYRLGYEFDNHNVANILRDNIGYANQQTDGLEANWTVQSTDDHNSWDEGFSVTDADFISLDPTGVDGARQAD